MKEDLENTIVKILQELSLGEDFRESTDLISDGFLDSLAVVSLIEAIHDETGVNISGDDVTPDNFKSIASLTNLVRKYQSG